MSALGVPAILLTVAAVAGGCATGDLRQTGSYAGDSGPVVNVDGGSRQFSLEQKP